MSQHTAIAMTIAGSDSGGGAGVQADIKAISATGAFACSCITALTAQNTRGVDAIHPVPSGFLSQQINTVMGDLDVDAIKIGMLGDRATIETVVQALRQHRPRWVVLDPVMVTSNGDLLLAEEAVDALASTLLPLAQLFTPNLYEALVLLDEPRQPLPEEESVIAECAQRLYAKYGVACLVKGGRQHGEHSLDALCDENGLHIFSTPRIDTDNTHGTGCSLSASIASFLAQGHDLKTAVELAKAYIQSAIAAGAQQRIGRGHGPIDHFFSLR